ncbi:MAG: hypothetical protein JWL80_357 [Parcubacteria group bacterium]|nr:hypothetical protein [Parcubacteria group bacterium]
MNILAAIPVYIKWHYSRGVVESVQIAERLLLKVLHFFSISVILRTFFSPWKREGMSYANSEMGSWFTTFIFNSLMRVLGMGIRVVILFFGLFLFLAALILSVAVVVGWILAPFAMIASFVLGIIELKHI